MEINFSFEAILRISQKIQTGLKKPRYYGTEDILYASEIHMIDIIGRNPEINITEIACKLGITKSAVTKIIRKLTLKGLVIRCENPYNKKVVQIKLTDKGSINYQGHFDFHKNFSDCILKQIDLLNREKIKLSDDIVSIIDDIVSIIEKCVDKMNKN